MAARYVVRYGTMRHLGEFGARDVSRDETLSRGSKVIVRSHRGTEYGEILSEATERTRELLGRTDSTGRILRVATPDDDVVREENWRRAESYFAGGREEIASHGLAMQLVDVELLFGGEKMIFFYLSEDRVDFRELVRSLAKRFKTRIEMRQIGIRDEAKLLADYGDCGKPVCCNTHLDKMPRVSMKMAKVQKASLDPNKISGRCGRLKCCLRYEYDTYVEHQKELPKQGKWIETDDGIGKVLAQEILAKKVLVAFEDGRRVLIDGADVKGIVPAPERPSKSDSRRRSGSGSEKSDGKRDGKPSRRGGGRARDNNAGKKQQGPTGSGAGETNADETSAKPKKRRRNRSRRRRKSNDGDSAEG